MTQTSDIEAKLEERFKLIAAKVKKTIVDELGDIETEYLPFLFTDLDFNVQVKTRAAIEDFLCGRESQHFKITDWHATDVRQAIYRDHKAEIIEALRCDFEKEIKSLKDCIDRQMEMRR